MKKYLKSQCNLNSWVKPTKVIFHGMLISSWYLKKNLNVLVSLVLMFLIYLPGFKKGGAVDFCQQAGCERLHDCGWDLAEPPAYLSKRPPVAHPGLLCAHWGGVRAPFDTQHSLTYALAKLDCAFLQKKVLLQISFWYSIQSFFLMPVYLHFCPLSSTSPFLYDTPTVLFTSRLCQGLEWMMSRLRVRWWPLTLIKSAPLLSAFLPPDMSMKWGWGR